MEGRAQQLEAQLLKQQETETDIAYKKAKTIEALRPQAKTEKADLFIQGISTALGAGKITPANAAKAISAYQKGDTETLNSLGFETTDVKPNIKEIGVAVGSSKPVYLDSNTDEQFVFDIDQTTGKTVRKPYGGGVDRTTARVSASATSEGKKAGSEEMYKLDAKRVDKAREAGSNAEEAFGKLTMLLNTPQGISGTGADARRAALRAFSTMGLTSAKDTQALTNADIFSSLAGENVLSFIKQLGVNPTDTDRQFAQTIGPALEKGEKTNKDLIQYLMSRSRAIMNTATAMEQHYYANDGSLKGFVSPERLRLTGGKSSSVEELSDAELNRLIQESANKRGKK
jgi:hypothetical protein